MALVAATTEEIEADFAEGERITQFEAATATVFVALRDAGVEVGVIEAGLRAAWMPRTCSTPA